MSVWWRQPDHFDWFTTYLHQRQLAAMTRSVLVAVSLSLAWIPLAMCFSSSPPIGPVHLALAIGSGVGGVTAASLWLIGFPTRNQSIGFALLSSASIAMAALAQSDPSTAMVACTAFATISGYIALFHTSLMMTANLVVVLAVSATPAFALAESGGVVRALCAYSVVLVVNIAVPYGIQIIVHTLGVDVLRADRDHLTGLYVRRAFNQRTRRLVSGQRESSYLVVAMIDLDRFKQLNDTRGHSEGDRVLAAVGHALRAYAQPGAVVGRAGGEEFLVADVFADPRPELFGQRLCDAIAALPFSITASVGTASVRCSEMLDERDPESSLTALIGAADAAMYVAKHNGGNQIRHAERMHAPPTTQPTESAPALFDLNLDAH
jgi:diguanylate cyclase (GGDEF)-like protein